MKHIMLAAKDTEAIAFDLAHLAAYLGRIHDPRHKQGKVYPLGMILALIFLPNWRVKTSPQASRSGSACAATSLYGYSTSNTSGCRV